MATYKLQSSALVYAPVIVTWAINGYHFKSDRKQLLAVISEGWNVPADAARALLSGDAPHTIEGETVRFTFPPENEPAPLKAPKPRKLTQAMVKSELNAMGLSFRRTAWGDEFRVNYRGGTEDSAYYTDDLSDALDTGKAMAAALAKRTRELVTLRLPVSLARAHALESFAI